MSIWDEVDGRAEKAIGRLFYEKIEYRPMISRRTGGGGYTQGAGAPSTIPDPARPVRIVYGIVTWAPMNLQTAADTGRSNEGGSTLNARLVVDIGEEFFPDNVRPKVDDRFYLFEEPREEDRLVRVTIPADDGSSRVVLYCSAVGRP